MSTLERLAHQLHQPLQTTSGPVVSAYQVLTCPTRSRARLHDLSAPYDSSVAAWLADQLGELWAEQDGFRGKGVFDEESEQYELGQYLFERELIDGIRDHGEDGFDLAQAEERIKLAIPFLAIIP